jgi:ribosomal protein S18 acetylase RimI-like enzyme
VDDLRFREEPDYADVAKVGSLLNKTAFFSPDEEEIGVSLVEERLEKGLSCGYLFVFAELAGILVGYSCYGPIPGTLDGHDLYWIAVDPDRQGRRYGSAILYETEKHVLGAGGKRLYAETSSTDLYTPTRAFYERNGFLLEGRLTDYYAPGDDKMLYVKRLA